MKLLSTPQGKSRREQENVDQELRAIELDKLIVAKRKELSDLDRLLISSLSEKSVKNYEEEQLWKNKIQELTNEVEALESRRKSALVPLEEREKKAQDRESALLKREEMVQIKESDIERTKELLEQRLDEISEREQEATNYSILLNNRRFNIEFQEKEIQVRSEAMVQILKESLEEVELAKAEAAKRKAILKGRDVSITEREKNVELQEAAFATREQKILDRYRSLQKAITETNLNQSGNNSNQRSTSIGDSN